MGVARGRGFVDGVLMTGKGQTGGLDWQRARAMLNGRLERIESPLESINHAAAGPTIAPALSIARWNP